MENSTLLCGLFGLPGTTSPELLASLFVIPLELPSWLRLWMFLPLAACIAAVYRATRARDTKGMAWATTITFLNIVIGMAAIAVGVYLVHEIVLRLY